VEEIEGRDVDVHEPRSRQGRSGAEAREGLLVRRHTEALLDRRVLEHHDHLRVEQVGLGEDQSCTRPEHAVQLAQGSVEVEVVEYGAAVHGVEVGRGIGHGLRVPAVEVHVGGPRHAGPSLGQKILGEVEAVDLGPRAGHLLQEHPRAAAQLQDPHPGPAGILHEGSARLGACPRGLDQFRSLRRGPQAAMVLDRVPDARGCSSRIGTGRGGLMSAQSHSELRAAKALIRSNSQPWRKREMLVSPYRRSW
jgi:hypothetical protein